MTMKIIVEYKFKKKNEVLFVQIWRISKKNYASSSRVDHCEFIMKFAIHECEKYKIIFSRILTLVAFPATTCFGYIYFAICRPDKI